MVRLDQGDKMVGLDQREGSLLLYDFSLLLRFCSWLVHGEAV